MTRDDVVARYLTDRSRAHRDAVLARYHYLCERGARKFVRPGTDRADLLQVAAIGLIKAVTRYDGRLDTPFEAYAWQLVLGELMHYVRDHEHSIRIPRAVQSLEKRYVRAADRLAVELGRRPTDSEIAEAMGVAPAVVDGIRQSRDGVRIVSIDTPLNAGVPDLPVPNAGPSPEDKVELLSAIGALAERERAIVLGTFASGLSQAELGRRLGLSQSQISKLMKKALLKIQQAVA